MSSILKTGSIETVWNGFLELNKDFGYYLLIWTKH